MKSVFTYFTPCGQHFVFFLPKRLSDIDFIMIVFVQTFYLPYVSLPKLKQADISSAMSLQV